MQKSFEIRPSPVHLRGNRRHGIENRHAAGHRMHEDLDGAGADHTLGDEVALGLLEVAVGGCDQAGHERESFWKNSGVLPAADRGGHHARD